MKVYNPRFELFLKKNNMTIRDYISSEAKQKTLFNCRYMRWMYSCITKFKKANGIYRITNNHTEQLYEFLTKQELL